MAKSRNNIKAGLQNIWESTIEDRVGELTLKSQRTSCQVILALIPQIFIIGFTIYITLNARPTSSLFSWHPTLMSIAFMILMTESIVLFSPWFALNPSISHEGKKFWHWFLHVCALMCAYTGLAVIIINKHNNLSLHFTTWHGTFGIVVCCLIAVQSTGGIIQLEPSLLPFKIRRVILKRLHAVSGTLTFIGVLTTLVLSLYSNWFLSVVFNDATWWIICSCPVTIGLIVIVQFIRNHFLPVIGK